MMPENKKSRKPRKIKAFGVVCGVPARIRTGGVPLRRRTLYPAEVQRHLAICGYFYSTHLPPFCERREVEQTLRREVLYPAELLAHICYYGIVPQNRPDVNLKSVFYASLCFIPVLLPKHRESFADSSPFELSAIMILSLWAIGMNAAPLAHPQSFPRHRRST